MYNFRLISHCLLPFYRIHEKSNMPGMPLLAGPPLANCRRHNAIKRANEGIDKFLYVFCRTCSFVAQSQRTMRANSPVSASVTVFRIMVASAAALCSTASPLALNHTVTPTPHNQGKDSAGSAGAPQSCANSWPVSPCQPVYPCMSCKAPSLCPAHCAPIRASGRHRPSP